MLWQHGYMYKSLLIFFFTTLSTTVLAQTAMTGDQFDAYTRGKTLFYGSQGERYGVEKYLGQRRVQWSFLDGKCMEGVWYESGSQICFLYENSDTPQCWSFFQSPEGLKARFQNSPDFGDLYEVQSGAEKMVCLGPEVGV